MVQLSSHTILISGHLPKHHQNQLQLCLTPSNKEDEEMVPNQIQSKKRASAAVGESSNPYLLLAVKIMFVLLILLLLPKFVFGINNGGYKGRRTERKFNAIAIMCARDNCADLLLEENMNCVNQCIDQGCYTEIYGDRPLEDGEIDNVRTRAFEICFKEAIRKERVKSRQEAMDKDNRKKHLI